MAPPPHKVLFNQVLNADITIKKNSHVNGEYKIVLKKNISPVLMNQIWNDEESPAAIQNQSRIVKQLEATEWTKIASSNPAYAPTVTLKLDKQECPVNHKDGVCRHMFVMNRSKVNKHGKIVFYVSSGKIVPDNANKYAKTLLKIPTSRTKIPVFHGAELTADPW